MDVIIISDRVFSQFELILTAEAIERLTPGPNKKADTFALGLVDGGMPLGAIAVRCSPPTAEVISLYIVEDFRRLGFGSQLLFEAITNAMILPGISEFTVPYTELPGEDVYTSFFNSLEMDIIDVGAEYKVAAADAIVTSGLLTKKPRHTVPVQEWSELTPPEQKLLFNEGAGLFDYHSQGKLREDLIFVAMDDARRSYRGCIAMAEEEGELVLAWLRAESSPFLMMELLRSVLRRLSDNFEQDKTIRIPTINPASDAIVHDLFSGCLEVLYYSKRVVFDFD